MTTISNKAITLILDFEGMDVPWEWPGEQSGITIGHGYDLGYESAFESDWASWLSEPIRARLRPALGKTGERARILAAEMHGVNIPTAAADNVFRKVTLPREIVKTITVFRGSERLNPDALGAMVSLVFNRGTDTTDKPGSDRRMEMRHIRNMLATPGWTEKDLLPKMANEFENMCRLWPNTRGLRRRRVAEAKLIRESIPAS